MIDVPVSLPEVQSADVVYFVEFDVVIFASSSCARRQAAEVERRRTTEEIRLSPAPNEHLDLQIVAILCNSPCFFFQTSVCSFSS